MPHPTLPSERRSVCLSLVAVWHCANNAGRLKGARFHPAATNWNFISGLRSISPRREAGRKGPPGFIPPAGGGRAGGDATPGVVSKTSRFPPAPRGTFPDGGRWLVRPFARPQRVRPGHGAANAKTGEI